MIIFFVTISFFITGCSSNLPIVKNGKEENETEFCRRFAKETDDSGQMYLVGGVAAGVLALAGIIVGSAIGPGKATKDANGNEIQPNWAEENRNTLILGGSSLLLIPAVLWLMGSRDHNAASADAGAALSLEKKDQLKACLIARSSLLSGRKLIAERMLSELPNKGGMPGSPTSQPVTGKTPPSPASQPPAGR